MSTTITPRLGAIVLYTLSEQDARQIIDERRRAGLGTFRGNDPHEGDTYPAMIVRDWGGDEETRAKYAAGEITKADEARTVITLSQAIDTWSCNLQVFLDGNDTLWVTSRSKFTPAPEGYDADPKGHWSENISAW
jgi:hypothetical protein